MIKAAVYGLGWWGQTLVNAIQGKSDKIRFVSGIARNLGKYQDFAKSVGITLTDDYSTVLADPAIDAVVLATPHSLHVGHIKQAASTGKHVFVEKPFTLTRDSAEQAVKACVDAKVTLSVGHNRRFLPSLREMKRIIGEGRIGDILHIEGQHSASSGYQMKPEDWKARMSENPAGGMGPLGIHTLDAMIFLNGLFSSVFAMSERRALPIEIDDTTSMLLRFKNGATGYMATILATRGHFWRLHVIGAKGWMEMHGVKSLTVSDSDGPRETKAYEDFDIQNAELEAFADAIGAGTPFIVPPEEIINGIAVFEAISKSAATGARVEIA